MHSFLLPLVPQDKSFTDYSFSPSDLKPDKPQRALEKALEVEVTTKDIKREDRLWIKFSTTEAECIFQMQLIIYFLNC